MRNTVRSLLWVAGILGAIGVLLHLFVFDAWTIPGNDRQLAASVLPALLPSDLVLVRRGTTPVYGELARCISPLTGTYVVGRVFGGGGDRVEVNDNVITTNGKGLASRHGCPTMTVAHPTTEVLVQMSCSVAETGAWSFSYLTAPEVSGGSQSATTEPGKLYLVSDNRVMHHDSRDYGQVDAATCEHIVFRLWGERFTDAQRRFTILW